MRGNFAFRFAFTLAVEPAIVAAAIVAVITVTATFVAVVALAPFIAIIALTIFTRPIFTGPILTLPIIAGTIFALTTLIAVFARAVLTLPIFTGAIIAVTTAFVAVFAFLTAGRAVECGEITLDAEIAAVVFAFLILPAFAAVLAGALFFLAGPGVGDHAEVVVGKLQVVFSLHAVTVKVRVLCKLAILFEQLGGIAPRTAVDPVELLTTILRAIVVTPPAPAVVTTIVIQLRHFLNWGGPSSSRCNPYAAQPSTTGCTCMPGFPASALVPARFGRSSLQMVELAGTGSLHPSPA